jgi:hypothetical protein
MSEDNKNKLRNAFGKWVDSLEFHVSAGKIAEFCQILDEAKKEIPRQMTIIEYYDDDDVQEMRKWIIRWHGEQP